MKTPLIIIALGLLGLAIAPAEEKPGKPLSKTPWNKPVPGQGQLGFLPRLDEPVKGLTEPIPDKYAGTKTVAIKLEALERADNGRYMATFRLINPTAQQISFTGYSETSPLTDTQQWKEGKWVDPAPVGICGTGLRDCYVGAGESAVFKAWWVRDQLPARLGIRYRLPDVDLKKILKVWSEKLEP